MTVIFARETSSPSRAGHCTRSWIIPVLLALWVPILPASAQVPEKYAHEELRLGGVSASEATAFVKEPSLIVDRYGRIYARAETEIRVFGFDGSLLNVLGGKGDGPGEFRSAFGHGLLGDTLWVIDPFWHPSRITRFSIDGQLLSTSAAPEVSQGGDQSRAWRVSHLLEGGHVITSTSANPGVGPSSKRYRIPIAIADDRLTDPKVIVRIEWPQGLLLPGLAQSGDPTFPLSPLFAVFPDGSGMVTVSWEGNQGGPIWVRKYDSAGRRVLEVVHVAPNTRVPGQVVDSLVADWVEKVTPIADRARRRGLDVPSNLTKAVEDGLPIPPYYPMVREVVAGIDGSIWLRRMRSFSDNTWFVLDSGGGPVFKVELPPGVNLQQASFGEVWATALGELDAPLILRYRLGDEDGRSPSILR